MRGPSRALDATPRPTAVPGNGSLQPAGSSVSSLPRSPALSWRRPLVVGASGQVGAALCGALAADAGATVLRSSRTPSGGWLGLDLAAVRNPDEAAAALRSAAPDLILCSGAMTFVDGCEAEPDQALRANAYGPSFLAAFAHSRGVPFVFFSSDYVFNGSAAQPGPYPEDAMPRPLSAYGRSKLEGERAVLRVHPGALVVRTTWVYGPDEAGKNFISSLLRQLRAGERVRVPEDQISTPTLNADLAHATLGLVRAGAHGVVHVAGPERMSRLALARSIASFFQLDPTLIEGVPTVELGQRALRPLHSGLRSDRLPGLLPSFRPRSLQEGLAASAAAT